MKLFLVFLLAALALAGSGAHAQTTPAPTSWEIAGEFNEISAVGPVWSYGSKLGSTFTPFTLPSSVACLSGYLNSLPLIAHNPLMTTCTDGIVYAPRVLVLHPGEYGEAATVRFTAPVAARYRISGQFFGMNAQGYGTHTAVSIAATNVINQVTTLYASSIALPGVSQAAFTSKIRMMRAGETLDFMVNAGPNNNYYYGSTGLHGVIEINGPWCGPTNPNNPFSSTC